MRDISYSGRSVESEPGVLPHLARSSVRSSVCHRDQDRCRDRTRVAYRSGCTLAILVLCFLFGAPLWADDARIDKPAAAIASTIIVLGDSISAGYGIDATQGWVTLLRQRLTQQAYPYRVVNASISGDTTAGGRSRLPALLLRYHPALVIIELGGNDGLRGLSLRRMHENLAAMIEAAQGAGARVLLLGLRLPPNYGPAYTGRFHAVYTQVARQRGVTLVPYLLAGVDDHPDLMQADGIHPVAAAQARLLDTVWARLRPLLRPPRS